MKTYGVCPSRETLEIIKNAEFVETELGVRIPKLIHYCWFGGNPLPESAKKCMESWKKFFPDFSIIEWNGSNFNVDAIMYAKEAYEREKYAFTSDVARFSILYQFGGLYFDTDVEVIKDMSAIVKRGPFMGCEKDYNDKSGGPSVAPGLGLGVNPGLAIYKIILESYSNEHFVNADGTNNIATIVDRTTNVLLDFGLERVNSIQNVAGLYIYPKEYFCPKIMDSDEIVITENTVSIHHYDASWADEIDKRSGRRAYKLRKIFGEQIGNMINTVLYGYEKYGVVGSIKRKLGKVKK